MSRDIGCEQVTELAPELALGIADGHERESALHQMRGCQTCRRLVRELSAVTDELPLLAPEHEAPPGLERGVLDAMSRTEPVRPRPVPVQRRRPWRRAWRVALVGAGIALAVAVGATGVF